MKRHVVSILCLVAWGACTPAEKENPFAELLEKSPYQAWTVQIRKDPNNDSLLYQRGVLLLTNDQYAAARIDFEKAWSINPQSVFAVDLAISLGSQNEQVAFLRKAMQQFPEQYDVQLMLAETLQSLDSLQAALNIAQTWMKLGIQAPEYLLLHASLLDQTGHKIESLSVLDSIYAFNPYNRTVLEILALRYANAGSEKILPICQQLKEADSLGNDAAPYYYTGIYYATKKQFALAHDQFDRAIRTDYNFKETYIEKAALFHEQKEYKRALDVLGKALAIAPDFAPVYYWTAKCQQALGDNISAKINYLKAYGLDQTFQEAKQVADALK